MIVKRFGEGVGSVITGVAVLGLAFNITAGKCGAACQSDLSDINDMFGKIVKIKKDKKNRKRKHLGANLPESEISRIGDAPPKGAYYLEYKGQFIRVPNPSEYVVS